MGRWFYNRKPFRGSETCSMYDVSVENRLGKGLKRVAQRLKRLGSEDPSVPVGRTLNGNASRWSGETHLERTGCYLVGPVLFLA